MLFGRKYPLYYNIPWDDPASYGSPKPVDNYIATDGKFVYHLEEQSYSSEFARLKEKEPRLKLSNFEGCPHYYGLMYMPNGTCYELQCKITKTYLEEASKMKGDWTGYKEGDFTNRFLSRTSLLTAFNLFKEIVK